MLLTKDVSIYSDRHYYKKKLKNCQLCFINYKFINFKVQFIKKNLRTLRSDVWSRKDEAKENTGSEESSCCSVLYDDDDVVTHTIQPLGSRVWTHLRSVPQQLAWWPRRNLLRKSHGSHFTAHFVDTISAHSNAGWVHIVGQGLFMRKLSRKSSFSGGGFFQGFDVHPGRQADTNEGVRTPANPENKHHTVMEKKKRCDILKKKRKKRKIKKTEQIIIDRFFQSCFFFF